MCGIAGFLRFQTEVPNEVVNRVLRALFPRIMCNIEERGRDASGMYQVHQDGDWMLAKTNRKPVDWVTADDDQSEKDPVVFGDFLRSWDLHPKPVCGLIGHARKATTGSTGSDNRDNHPFAVQLDERNAILGVHNGTLDNHERIFTKLKELGSPLEREGKVDSEALFHLLYHASDGGSRPWTLDDLYSVCRKVSGAYALVAMNSRFPEHAVVMRDGRPLEVTLVKPINVAILCSEKRFVENALHEYRITRKFCSEDLPSLEVETRMVAERTARVFDLTKDFPETLEFKSLDSLAEYRDLNKWANTQPDEEWKRAISTSFTSTHTPATSLHQSNHSSHIPITGVGNNKGCAQKPTPALGPGNTSAPVQAKLSKDPGKITAEISVPEAEEDESRKRAKEALPGARLLDLSPVFFSINEVAQALGINSVDVGALTRNDLATRMTELGFVQGYAMRGLDAEAEIERVLRGARRQSEKLELAVGKRKRSQRLILELRTLLAGCRTLSENGLDVSPENLRTVLLHTFKGDEKRVSDILQTYEQMVGEGSNLEGAREAVRESGLLLEAEG